MGPNAAWGWAGLREAPAPQQVPSAGPAPSSDNPGLVEEFGKLFDKISIIPLKRPGETSLGPPAAAGSDNPAAAGNAAERPAGQGAPIEQNGKGESAKDLWTDTGETLSRLSRPSSMISGRSVCPVAANGTPDCKLGADRLCQGKGYKEGKSLNTDSAESCSASSADPGPPAQAGRLPNGRVRHVSAVPIGGPARSGRPASISTQDHVGAFPVPLRTNCHKGMMSGMLATTRIPHFTKRNSCPCPCLPCSRGACRSP